MAPPPLWPAAALAGLGAGIALCPLPDSRLLAAALLGVAAAALALRPPARTLLLVAAACVALGYLRAEVEFRLLAQDPLAGQDRTTLEVRGTVMESPRPRSWGSAFRFRLERVEQAPDLAPTDVLVELRDDSRIAVGERWRFVGRLGPLPGARHPRGFDAGAWLGRQGVHHRLKVQEAEFLEGPTGWTPLALAWRLRLWLAGNLEGRLSPEVQALVLGIALGESRAMPRDLQEAFRRSGTSHLLAASGLNVAIVTGLVFWISRRMGYGRKPAAVPALLAAAFYALLAGGSPSVVRAAIMASVALLALVVGRRSEPLHSLLLAGVLVLLVKPLWLQDVGFQLSFAAVAGMLAWYGPLERRLVAWPRPLRMSVAASLSAGLAVAPLLAWHFQEISVVSVLANLVMTPVAEALLPLGLAAAALAGLWPPLAALPLLLCTLGGEYLLAAATGLGDLVDPVRVPRPGLAAAAACLVGFAWLRLVLAREGPPRLRPVLALVALLLASLALAPGSAGGDTLKVRVADLPGGTVAWVLTPGGRDLLLVESEEARTAAEELLALYGRRGADACFVLQGGPPRTESPEPGLRVERRPGALRATWGGFSFLWASPQAEPEEAPPGTVVLVPRPWTPSRVLPRVQPQLTVWPGGRPRKAWRTAHPAWWSTTEHGPLEVETDGIVVRWRRWEG